MVVIGCLIAACAKKRESSAPSTSWDYRIIEPTQIRSAVLPSDLWRLSDQRLLSTLHRHTPGAVDGPFLAGDLDYGSEAELQSFSNRPDDGDARGAQGSETRQTLQAYLTHLGAEGWELVAILPSQTFSTSAPTSPHNDYFPRHRTPSIGSWILKRRR